MNQLEYIPGIGGQSVQMDGPSSFVGIAENLRSREWEYDLGYRDLVSATRPAREVDVTFHADYATADELRRVADADVTAKTPGVFIAQKEWRQRGYVLASKPNDIHFGRLSTELKVALLDGAWWRLVSRSFVTEDTTPEYRSATGKSVTTNDAANVPLHALTVDGEAVQDGTPTPNSPVEIQVVQAPDGGTFGISINGTVTPIDLQGNVLASLPDGTKDVLTVDSAGHCVLEKRTHIWNMRDYSGSTWNKSGSATNGFYISRTTLNPVARTNQFGSHYSSITTPVSNTSTYFSTTNSSYLDGSFNFNLDASVVGSTVADFKTWLSSHDVFVCAKLDTEQTIDLGTIDMPNVFDGAVVSITAEVTPTITAEWEVATDLYLNYPHNYSHDYQAIINPQNITPSVLTPSDVHIIIYGAVENPIIGVGDNSYQVNVSVPAGGYLTIDGREKTIMLTLADGTVQNVFSAGVRGGGAGSGDYIFEPIPAGESEVTWDGSFGFDLGWYEEEGEPPWSQS